MGHEINAIFAIAQRDFLKFLRDRFRILATFVFPFVFVGILGGSLQANFPENVVGYSFLAFALTGVVGQTLFQSTASGIISLVQDRETDFAQEMFVAPVSRYTIILGKILGESMVAFTQTLGILVFGLILGVQMSLGQILALIPAGIAICLLGGAFGVLVMANLPGGQRSANQIFPFVIFPQFFLAGVFSPIKELPSYLFVLSRLAPMTYAVDLARNAFYWGKPEAGKVILHSPIFNLLIIVLMFLAFIFVGTYLFVRNERNR